ncbi:MAG: ParM/StbA family protein [Mariprofundaceae bacterium]|nr:ParM/StbA family protein [Mariprofundaceae bacterium]
MEIIGLDIGFGFTKASNGKKSLIFKSVYGEATDFQYREPLLDGDRLEQYLQIDIDGNSYFVGELAERQSTNRFFTLDQAQFMDQPSRILALAAMSNLVESNQAVKLVLGLPISHYRKYKQKLHDLLKTTHDIIITDSKGLCREKKIKVADVRVIPQPFGSIMNYMLNDQGKMSEQRFSKEKIGIIDVGFCTTDYTISDKTRYSERGSMSVQTGMSKAFAIIATRLKDISGVNVELYRLFDSVHSGSIKIRGKSYDLKKVSQQALGQLAASIASDANRLWADDWDMDEIIVTGGGGAVLAPFIQPLLEGNMLSLNPSHDYRLNNVQGYCKFGKSVWHTSDD